jgi:hypothetical protein
MPTERMPTVDQILMAPERPTLSALDTMLGLATRSLLAENPGLTPKPFPRPAGPADPKLALAASAVMLSNTLREVIACYLAHLDQNFADGHANEDDDIPF